MRRVSSGLRLGLVTLVTACGPSVGDPGGGGSQGGSHASTAGADGSGAASGPDASAEGTAGPACEGDPCFDSCGCFREGTDDDGGAKPLVCPAKPLCPPVELACPRPEFMYGCGFTHEYVVADEAALDCALAVLRDRSPGALIIHGEHAGYALEGPGTEVFELRTLGTASVLVTSGETHMAFGSSWSSPVMRHELAAADDFTACLEISDGIARYQCLWEGIGKGEPMLACEG